MLRNEQNPVHTATISGGVHALNAMNVQIHFSTINGGIDIHGGSGPFGGPFDVTWNTIEDSTVNGGYNEVGYDGFWNGFIRNNVHGSVNINGNTVMDADGNEIVTNTIHGNLNCQGNDPPPQVGDSGGSPNHVTGETGRVSRTGRMKGGPTGASLVISFQLQPGGLSWRFASASRLSRRSGPPTCGRSLTYQKVQSSTGSTVRSCSAPAGWSSAGRRSPFMIVLAKGHLTGPIACEPAGVADPRVTDRPLTTL